MNRAKRVISLLLCCTLMLPAAACGKTPAGPQEPDSGISGVTPENYPRIDGSTANIPLIVALYSAVHGVSPEEAETQVQVSGGTGEVWRNMMWGEADLLLVYEAPENIKEEIAQNQTLKWETDPIGRDGLVFLVNAGNPVDSLTREQLIGIYTGRITDWSEVGGDSGPIVPFQRNAESGSQTLFLKLLMGETPPMEPPSELVPAFMGDLIDAVATYDGAGGSIGFSVYYYANLMYTNPNLKLLKVDGVAPSADSIGDERYPLVNDFFVVIRESEPEGSPARLLRDWLISPDGAELLRSANYIPVLRQ